MPSPTQLTLKLLRDKGYDVAVVEHWNAFAHKRQDFLGCVDMLAWKGARLLGVQTSTCTNHAAHRTKMLELLAPASPLFNFCKIAELWLITWEETLAPVGNSSRTKRSHRSRIEHIRPNGSTSHDVAAL